VKHARRDRYIGLWAHLPIGGWIMLEICVSLVAAYFARASFPLVVVTWTVIATGIIMFLGNMVCVYYMDRYALVLLISSAIGAAAALAGIAEIGVETPECIMTRPAR
jgi:Zn-dependent protease